MSRADIIKVAAVVTAIPRWVVALLASEGFILPLEWRGAWIIFSALAAAGMAIVEGVAFAYVFQAWRTARAGAWKLLALALTSAALFVVLLTPSIAASVRMQTIGDILRDDALLFIWSATVAASTISIVASVGYAERVKYSPAPTPPSNVATPEATTKAVVAKTYTCVCGEVFAKPTAKAIHSRYCATAKEKARANGHAVESITTK